MVTEAPGTARARSTAEMIADVGARLRARGERMTRPRRAVLTVLAAEGGHLGAEELVGRVAAYDPRVHRATVYRTLVALAELGVVENVHVRRTGSAYHLVRGKAHLHVECLRCGTLQDLPLGLLDGVGRVLAREHGFRLAPTHVALSGLCAACAATEPSPRG